MTESKDLIAYCGLYCGDCVGHQGKVADLARDLRKELRQVKFGKTADGESVVIASIGALRRTLSSHAHRIGSSYSPLTISFSSFSNLRSFGGSYGSVAIAGFFSDSGVFSSFLFMDG